MFQQIMLEHADEGLVNSNMGGSGTALGIKKTIFVGNRMNILGVIFAIIWLIFVGVNLYEVWFTPKEYRKKVFINNRFWKIMFGFSRGNGIINNITPVRIVLTIFFLFGILYLIVAIRGPF